MLINNYLEANKEFVTDEDSMNIVDNRIHSWNFVNVTQPSIDILYSLIDSVAKSERNAAKIKQIEQLESLITARKLREAVLSGDNSFIQNIENQISAIRATLE